MENLRRLIQLLTMHPIPREVLMLQIMIALFLVLIPGIIYVVMGKKGFLHLFIIGYPIYLAVLGILGFFCGCELKDVLFFFWGAAFFLAVCAADSFLLMYVRKQIVRIISLKYAYKQIIEAIRK